MPPIFSDDLVRIDTTLTPRLGVPFVQKDRLASQGLGEQRTRGRMNLSRESHLKNVSLERYVLFELGLIVRAVKRHFQ